LFKFFAQAPDLNLQRCLALFFHGAARELHQLPTLQTMVFGFAQGQQERAFMVR
jgi:hypothetical protein